MFIDIISVISSLTAVVTVLLLYLQLRNNQIWNRRKTAEEYIDKLISGELSQFMNALIEEFEWDILCDDKTYDEVIKELDPVEVKKLNQKLRRVFRILEGLAIGMKWRIVDEIVVFDYIYSIFNCTFVKGMGFVDFERANRCNPDVFSNFEAYYRKWTDTEKKLTKKIEAKKKRI